MAASAQRKFDPYAALEVGRDADAAAIKRAYRQRAKTAHPDAGGSAEEFGAVKRAHLVLLDPKRREQFDRTGEAEEPAPDTRDQAALNLIMGMLASVLMQDPDPFGVDLVKVMRGQLEKDVAEIKGKLSGIKRALKRAEKMSGRFRRKSGDNVLERMMGWHIEQLRRAEAGMGQSIEDRKRGIEMLVDYSFEHDVVRQVFTYATSATSTSATTGW